ATLSCGTADLADSEPAQASHSNVTQCQNNYAERDGRRWSVRAMQETHCQACHQGYGKTNRNPKRPRDREARKARLISRDQLLRMLNLLRWRAVPFRLSYFSRNSGNGPNHPSNAGKKQGWDDVLGKGT